jgi:hypothetical protein
MGGFRINVIQRLILRLNFKALKRLFFIQGDSGGALVSEHDQRMVMVGVMSGGIGCGRANIPGVYTSVTSYLGWINETISRWNEPSSRSSIQHWTGLDTQHRLSLLKRDVEQQLRRFPGLSQIRQSS